MPAPVVGTGTEKIREDIVLIGGADEAAEWKAHFPGNIAGKNVTEVAGGDAEVQRRAGEQTAGFYKRGVGGKVIDHLRDKTADIDGIGGGKAASAPPE